MNRSFSPSADAIVASRYSLSPARGKPAPKLDYVLFPIIYWFYWVLWVSLSHKNFFYYLILVRGCFLKLPSAGISSLDLKLKAHIRLVEPDTNDTSLLLSIIRSFFFTLFSLLLCFLPFHESVNPPDRCFHANIARNTNNLCVTCRACLTENVCFLETNCWFIRNVLIPTIPSKPMLSISVLP